jgi:hypothetical protein
MYITNFVHDISRDIFRYASFPPGDATLLQFCRRKAPSDTRSPLHLSSLLQLSRVTIPGFRLGPWHQSFNIFDQPCPCFGK